MSFLLSFKDPKNKKNIPFWGNLLLFNRESLIDSFNLSNKLSDTEIVISVLKEKGPEGIIFVNGSFSFVLFIQEINEYWVFKDRLGSRSLFYTELNNEFIFSQNIKALQEIQATPLNKKYIANVAKNRQNGIQETMFESIMRFPPACYGIIKSNNEFKITKYWNLLGIKENLQITRDEAIEKAKILIEKAVLKRIKENDTVGCQLSGGLDSSLIAAILQKYNKLNYTFSFVLNEKTKKFSTRGIDEQNAQYKVIEYAKININCHIKIDDFHFKTIDESLNYRYNLIRNFSGTDGYWQDTMFKKAADNKVTHMFSGFPGDEGISSTGTLWYLDLFYFKKWSSIIKLSIKNPILIIHYFYSFVKINFYKDFYFAARKEMYSRGFLKQRLFTNIRSKNKFNASHKSKLISSISSPNITLRTESENIYANQHGIQMAYPLADVELLEFLVSLPSEFLKPGKHRRQFFRDICLGYLPDEIVEQPKQNGAMTLAFAEYWIDQMVNYFQENGIDDRLNLFVDPKSIDLTNFEQKIRYTKLGEMCYFINKHLDKNA